VDPTDQFGPEGYWALLVGQQVPYARTYEPSAGEWQFWNAVSARIRELGMTGLTVPEALRVIRSPQWTWPAGLYHPAMG
jgi:hypothetical protein